MRTIRIGAGAGFAGDRIEPAVELARHGRLDYLVFECLAERTIAIAQQARLTDPSKGYDVLLDQRMSAVLAACRENGTRIVTNMGAANPLAAAERVCDVARRLGLGGLKVAAVTGDDVLEAIRGSDLQLLEGGTLADLDNRIISANAYIGAVPIVEALAAGADVVVTGRAADPALFLGPLIHSFGWAADDWNKLGRGVLAGHLLECAGQVTGGYFADPGVKDVAGLAHLGFPIGEVSEDGDLVVTKLEGTGGAVTTATVKEQLLYEIEDPARYLQPDVIADFSQVRVRNAGPDRVAVEGGGGTARTGLLKVSIGYVGEGQISYAGTGAVGRGRLALEIVRERLAITGVPMGEARFDLIGVDALHGAALSQGGAPYEVRVRVAARTEAAAEAIAIGNEVEALYTNGPAGGGGVTKSVRQVVAIASALAPDSVAPTQLSFFEA
ncbi:acyclic terpene utilization AtuA family protein [Bosea sp. AS-1]|uniref:acyclic terpene utilization AtuA family protein n=1 Tax=Bosea sp. AS-1 TaxID=2015316 RepID=UPI000B779C7D|nr:acyclic terpene utilization AtuA family protein [Bosea sp. AS-1]